MLVVANIVLTKCFPIKANLQSHHMGGKGCGCLLLQGLNMRCLQNLEYTSTVEAVAKFQR